MASVVTLEKLARADNPKVALIAQVGDLSKVELLSNRVLVAIYIAPEVMKKGINDKGEKFELLRTTTQMAEDVFQGCVGLVLKKASLAFKDDEATKTYFHGQDVNVGDWVVFRPGDAKRIQINGVDCRFVEDVTIDMIVEDPEIITHRNK
jgi:hypothetical protein